MYSSFVSPNGGSSRYAVLAANVSQVISSSTKRRLEPTEKRLLDRAADLLDTIVQGSRFVELHESHALFKPQESLFAFDQAISALSSIDHEFDSNIQSQLTDFFERLKECLRCISNDENIDEAEMEAVKQFFNALCELFYQEVVNKSAFSNQTMDFQTIPA